MRCKPFVLMGVLLSLLAGPARAQLPAAQALPADTVQVRALLAAAKAAGPGQVPAALRLVEQARQGARRLRFGPGEAEANLLLGRLYRNQGRAAAATRCLQAAIRQTQGVPRLAGTLFLAYVALAQTAGTTHAFAEARQYLLQAEQTLADCSPAQRQQLAPALHGSWANLYYQWATLGGLPDAGRQALHYSRLELRANVAAHDSLHLGGALRHLSNAYASLELPDSAAYYLAQEARLYQALGNVFGEASTLSNLAITRLDQRQWAQAVALARRSIHLDSGRSGPESLGTNYAVLREALPHLGAWQAAYRVAEAHLALQDSVHAISQTQELNQLRVGFDVERKEARIRVLEADRRLKTQAQELATLRVRQQLAGLGGTAGLLLLLAGGSFVAYRRRQAAAAAAAETLLRQQIAADLHDDVGSLLTQVSLQSDLLSQGLLPADQHPAQLQRMASTSREAVRHMSDVVWGLSQLGHAPTLGPLLDRMRDHAHLVLPVAGLDLNFVADPALKELPVPTAPQQVLFLVFKECLHNAVKHAQGATEVTVALRHEAGCLELVVRDDGRAPAAAPVPRPGHGLANMPARVAALGGTVRYEVGNGFGVVARVPLG